MVSIHFFEGIAHIDYFNHTGLSIIIIKRIMWDYKNQGFGFQSIINHDL